MTLPSTSSFWATPSINCVRLQWYQLSQGLGHSSSPRNPASLGIFRLQILGLGACGHWVCNVPNRPTAIKRGYTLAHGLKVAVCRLWLATKRHFAASLPGSPNVRKTRAQWSWLQAEEFLKSNHCDLSAWVHSASEVRKLLWCDVDLFSI